MQQPNEHPADGSLAESMPASSAAEDITAIGFNTAISALPIIGGPMSSMFSGSLAFSDKRRQEAWLKQLATQVDRLREREDLTLEDVVTDEKFVTAVVKGVRLMRETENEEKLRIITNAVCNSGAWAANEGAVQAFFMRLLERYEPEHILFLKACDNPQEFVRVHGSAVGNGQVHWIFANVVYKDIVQWEPLASNILRDLGEDHLITPGGLGLGYNLSEAERGLTTPMGHEFLMFCSDPTERV